MMATGQRRGLSIRARLALWYAASVLLVFLVFALALRVTVRAALRDEFTTGVRSSSDAIRSFFRLEHAEYRDVNATIVHIANEVVFPDRVVEFQRPDGAVAFRVAPDRTGSANAGATAARRTAMREPVQQLLVPLDSAIAPGWVLRVYASAAPLERTLTVIDRWLLIGVPLGFLFAGGLGWWLAERTLRPVAAMAEAASRMTRDRRTGAFGARDPAAHRLPIDNPTDELGRLGTRFNAVLDQLDGVLAQQRRFLADAAHELRTPVARMLATVDLAQLDPADTAGQGDALQRVRTDLDRTTRLIDELLQLARADAAGAVHARAGYIDDVIADAVHTWQPTAQQRRIHLTVATLDEAPAQIDPVYLERLIGILLDNAIRYTPAGGSIAVSVVMPAGVPRVIIADTGIGIPPDEHSRIFERFYRGTRARAMSPDGTGLGLPIAHWIAEAHDATLDVVANGTGTVATVTFPPAAQSPVPASVIGAS